MIDPLPSPLEVSDGSWPFRLYALECALDLHFVDFSWNRLAADSIALGATGEALLALAIEFDSTDSATILELVRLASEELQVVTPPRAAAVEALALMFCEYVMVGQLSLEEALNAILSIDGFAYSERPLMRFWLLADELDAAQVPEWTGVSHDEVAMRVESTMRDFLRESDHGFAGRLLALTSR